MFKNIVCALKIYFPQNHYILNGLSLKVSQVVWMAFCEFPAKHLLIIQNYEMET